MSGPSAHRSHQRHGDRWADTPATRVIIHRAHSKAAGQEMAFVLRAVGIPHAQLVEDGNRLLVVPAAHALRARQQLERYTEENRDLPDESPAALPTSLARGRAASIVYLVLLPLVDQLAARRAFGFNWKAAGRIESTWVGSGELWRGITALTLHADVPHLAGNMLFGAGFGLLIAQLLGSGLGWAAIVLAGFTGNLLAASVEPASIRSLGASTAVFGAVGMLAALSFRLRHRQYKSRLRRWAPWVMGLALLGFLGTAGERTNVLSHATGFVSGCVWGVVLSPLVHRRPGAVVQTLAALAALGAVVGAWVWALG